MINALSRLCLAVFMCSLGFLPGVMAQQQIDLDSDGMGDVWEQFFNATSLNPGGDEDFDGYSNLDESLAGTDPFDADSAPGFSEYDASGGEREDFRWHHHDGDPDCGHR